MFYKMKLYGVIASEFESMIFGDEEIITLKQVDEGLKNANGSDIEVSLSSVGGRCDIGVDIFFAFRDYKRDNPNSQMILNIKSQCASMASHLAAGEFWDLVTVEDISSHMIHNPSSIAVGDYREMKECAEFLENLSALYSGTYAMRSGKFEKEIRTMMDKTTYLYGQEIVDAGFADEVLSTKNDQNKKSDIAQMQLKYNAIMEKMQQAQGYKDEYKKAVAKIKDNTMMSEKEQEKNMQQPAGGGNNKMKEEGLTMANTLDELRIENPCLYSETVQAGKTEMIANNKAIMEFRDKEEYKNLPFIHERCDKAVMEGESFEDLKMAVMALMLDPKNQASIESPGDINTGVDVTMSGEQGAKNKDEVRW